jgi:hypothetical protein
MSDLNPINPSGPSEISELKGMCAELQSQVHTSRVVLLVVIGSLCLFFWREASFNGRIARQLEPQVLQANQIANALSKQGSSFDKQLQAIQAAVARLVEYGRTHPDYVSILNKHGVPVSNPAAPTDTVPAGPKK